LDKNRIEGSWEQTKGRAKEGIGKATGDQKMEGEGKAQKIGGKVQNTAGGIADSARDASKDRDRD
jgi:uncharacterized protein YjbJ (UPF0337 family)